MKTLFPTPAPFAPMGSMAQIVAGFGGHRIRFDAPKEGGASETVVSPVVPPAVPPVVPPVDDKLKPSDAEAKLVKEVMEKKGRIADLEVQLKAFDGIDPAKVKDLLQKEAAAALAAAEAAGDFERVKTMIVEEHGKEKTTLSATIAELQAKLAERDGLINELTVGSAFDGSEFIAKELVVPKAKARIIYASHFEIEAGRMVGYDKPKGAATRTKLVGGDGNPLGFEDAIKKLVEADPDRDTLLKSKLAPGASSQTDPNAKPAVKTSELSGAARIAAALTAQKAAKK